MADEILCGDALSTLKTLQSESIDCCITSPPYYALRDYQNDGQIGLEPTFHDYLDNLIAVFDEVKRVLKTTGTCWVVLGDSCGGVGGQNVGFTGTSEARQAVYGGRAERGLKENVLQKSLIGTPFRFATAMIDRKWILRNTVIWHKPSCMPSSAKDRFTNDFEYIFFFVKSKKYWFEQQFEPYAEVTLKETSYNGKSKKDYENALAQNPSDTKRRVINSIDVDRGRNKRAVWAVNTANFKGAHFAVFPEKLIEPMIRAGCPFEICDECGYAFERDFQHKSLERYELPKTDSRYRPARYHGENSWQHGKQGMRYCQVTDNGIKRCDCNASTSPGTVLDPFSGSGTVAVVARKLDRHYIGCDLNPDYVKISENRLAEVL